MRSYLASKNHGTTRNFTNTVYNPLVIVIVIVKYDSYKTQIQNNIKMDIIIIIDYRWLYSLKFI